MEGKEGGGVNEEEKAGKKEGERRGKDQSNPGLNN